MEVDETKRRKIFAELQAILLRDLPILPQVVASRNIITRRTVQDYPMLISPILAAKMAQSFEYAA